MNILMITDNDPAGMAIAFANAINRHTEHTCRLITTSEKYGFEYEKDIHLPDIEDDDFGEVEQLLKNADIIHFHVLRDENSHLGPLVIRDYIKEKRILHHHHGHPDYILNVGAYNEKYRQRRRKVIVSTPDLLKIAGNATWIPNLVPLKDVQFMPRFDRSLPQEPIRICQSPTRKFDKHTREYRNVIAGLLKKYDGRIESLIIEKRPYFECLQIKKKCHIVFDHMRGWFGIASLESLSHGKPVIAGLDEWNIRCIREFTGGAEIPWVVARTEEELYKAMDRLIGDGDLRQQIGERSRHFMESSWSERKVLDLLLSIYASL
jgi:glycosyltransferase involved in cell wall biosynthesis